MMEVKLLVPCDNYGDFLLKKIYTAARLCYSSNTPQEIWEKDIPTEKMLNLLNNTVIASGHLSVLRHAELSFLISGISRACSMQLIRHHAGVSVEQQSQRYVKLGNTNVVIPPLVANNSNALEDFNQAIDAARINYDRLLSTGISPEDARAVLPNATTTNLILTVNLEALMNICGERLCSLAQLEIRKLFAIIRRETVKQVRWMAPHLTIKCIRYGICTEKRNEDQHCTVRPHISKINIVLKDKE